MDAALTWSMHSKKENPGLKLKPRYPYNISGLPSDHGKMPLFCKAVATF